MKNTINTFFLVIFSISLNAQVKIGDDPTNFNNEAMLEIQSDNKGLLIPRVWLQSTTTPLSGSSGQLVKGMVVYNIHHNLNFTPEPLYEGLYYCDGSKWVKMMTIGGIGAAGGDGDAWGVDNEDITSNINRNGNVSISGNGYSTFLAKTESTGASVHPTFMCYRTRNSGFPKTGDILGGFIARDGLGVTNYGGAGMYIAASEDYSSTAKGSKLIFQTTDKTRGTPLEKFSIEEENINLGYFTPTNNTTIPAPPFVPGFGARLNFHGGRNNSVFNSDNSDPIFITRYNREIDGSELRISVGDNQGGSYGSTNFDLFSVGGTNYPSTDFKPIFNVNIERGAVGIGTTAPTQKLEVTGNILAKSIPATSSLLGNDGGLELYRDGSTAVSNHINGFIDFHSSPTSDYEGRLFYGTKLTPSLNKEGYIFSFSNNGSGTSDFPMVILRNGNVGIGGINNGFFTGNPSTGYMTDLNARLVVGGQKTTAGLGTGISNWSNPTGGVGTSWGAPGTASDGPSQAIITAGSNGSSYLNDWPLGWGGGLATWDIVGAACFFNAYVQRSDAKLKKDILSMDLSITEKLMKLRPVTYFMKKETPEVEGLQYGFIAQEVREIFPTIVTKAPESENSVIGMNYSALIAPTVYVVQQQQKMIEDLKRENEEIKAQLKLILESVKK